MRDAGSQRAVISTEDASARKPSFQGACERVDRGREPCRHRLVREAPSLRRGSFELFVRRRRLPKNAIAWWPTIAVRRSPFLHNLVRVGCDLTVVPWDTAAEDVLALEPDGVFLSNGPATPRRSRAPTRRLEKLLGSVPVFGICLGHQMISGLRRSDREAEVRSSRRQPAGYEPAHGPRRDHRSKPRLRVVPQPG